MKPRFGVNYVPARSWWYLWLDWDGGQVREDFAAIAALGCDHVRVHLVWPYFQPNPGHVNPAALRALADLLDAADEHGLDVCVAVLDGWLSGFAFEPAWLRRTAGKPALNLFLDEPAILAEAALFAALGAVVRDHPRFLGFDLGNELGVMHHFGHPAEPEEADRWHHRMLAAAERAAPGRFHVNGVDHAHWFRRWGFTPRTLATTGAATPLHCWTEFTGARARFGDDSGGTRNLLAYMIELARAFADDPDRPIWVQEFGQSAEWMPEERIPAFAVAAIEAARARPNLWGITWWCSHDIHPRFAGFAKLEYDLGLLTTENEPKPVALAVAAAMAAPEAPPPAPTVALLLPPDFASGVEEDWRAGDLFVRLVESGERPMIVREESRAGGLRLVGV